MSTPPRDNDGAVLIVGGVSGSGKTTVGRRLAARLGWEFIEGDDYHPQANLDKMRRGEPLTDADRLPWLRRLREQIERRLAQGRRAVLASSALKRRYRKVLQADDDRVRFVFLTGDMATLRRRLEQREGHFFLPELLQSQIAELELSNDHARFDVEDSPDELVESIAGWLCAGPVAGDDRGSAAPDWEAQPPRTLYAGTYTRGGCNPGGKAEGLHVCRFDPCSGRLTLETTVRGAGTQDPSYLSVAPGGATVYVVNEMISRSGIEGSASAFVRDPASGGLRFLNQRSTGGFAPCHVSVDPVGRHVLVANYESGSVGVLPILVDGSLEPLTDLVHYEGSGPNPQRQRGPHAHMILPDPLSDRVYGVDLGSDRIHVHRLVRDSGRLQSSRERSLQLPPGTGPRHLARHPSRPLAFVVGELSSTLISLHLDEDSGPSPLDARSTLPDGFEGDNLPAALEVSRCGRFVYVSNRGHDSIAQFAIDADRGGLELLGHTSTQGRTPRSFSFDASGRWLLVANQFGDSIVTFPVDPGSGRPGSPAHRLDIATPVCLTWGDGAPSAAGSSPRNGGDPHVA